MPYKCGEVGDQSFGVLIFIVKGTFEPAASPTTTSPSLTHIFKLPRPSIIGLMVIEPVIASLPIFTSLMRLADSSNQTVCQMPDTCVYQMPCVERLFSAQLPRFRLVFNAYYQFVIAILDRGSNIY